jgi:Fe-S oxidoreductase
MQHNNVKDIVDIEILSIGPEHSIQDIIILVTNKAPDLIGLSTYIWTVFDNMALAEGIKKKLPEVKIILGGPQVSDIHWDILQYTPYVDGVIRGEGEAAFADMLKFWLDNGSLCDPSIAGLSYRDISGKIIHNSEHPPIKDMDIIPSRYKGFHTEKNKIYGLETARGCYNRCGYCSLGGMSFRTHSVEYVLNEIDHMAEAGVKMIFFYDCSFTFNQHRMELISRKLAHYGIRYLCCVEAEELNEEMIDILLETGAIKIEFGLQTTNPYALKLMNRKCDLDLFERNVHLFMSRCKEYDAEVNIDVICGLPGDNLQTFCQSMDFVYKLKPHRISAIPLLLLPGTDFFVNREKYGFKFIPFTKEQRNVKSRYNMDICGLVLENMTFPRNELDKGKSICLFNKLLRNTKYTKLTYEILDKNNITFTQFYNTIEKYLSESFYDCLETDNDSSKSSQYVNSISEAFFKYNIAMNKKDNWKEA